MENNNTHVTNGIMENSNHMNGFTDENHCDTPAKICIKVDSPNVEYSKDGSCLTSYYSYLSTKIHSSLSEHGDQQHFSLKPVENKLVIRTGLKVPKTGLMLVGWGGNNGSTLTCGILANKLGLSWRTRTGVQKANYFGSLTQSGTMRLGSTATKNGGSLHADVFLPFKSLLPLVDPNDLVLGGWDISGKNLAQACERAQVLEPDLLGQLAGKLAPLKPLPSIYYPEFVAANQNKRADNLIKGDNKFEHLETIRGHIREFKARNNLDTVLVIWTATTERFSDVIPNVNDTAENLLASIRKSHAEIAPSTIFAAASILEHCPFVNGSPQNTFVPGVVDLARKNSALIAGDDFKSGQTKVKTVLVDFLVGAGIKPLAVTSYNHLGNNDGENLSAPDQFRSKEISKSSVVQDAVASNRILYPNPEADKPDHTVVIKYTPAVGDNKRALDEYFSEIFLGGRNTLSIYNVCEDSLLAAPLIIDLAILAEFLTRVEFKKICGEESDEKIDDQKFEKFSNASMILGYFLKAPLPHKEGAPVVNSLFRQRQILENLFNACLGLPIQNGGNLFENIV